MNKYVNKESAVKAIAYEHTRVMVNDSDINEQMGGYNPSAFIAGFLAALTRVKDILVSFPASDVEPVVHAQWEFVDITGFGNCTTARCSHCKKPYGLYINGNKPEWKRCPECGAKMDLEVKE